MPTGTTVWPLLPYQARWVRDANPFKLCVKSRRIGISWAEAHDATLSAAVQGGVSTYYQAYEHDMTSTFISDAYDRASEIRGALAQAGIEEILLEGNAESRRRSYRLRFASGAEIVGMSSNPAQFRSRGKAGHRAVIDEAAYVADLNDVLKAARAFRMWKGRVRVISTHNGATSPFARLVDELREGSRPGSLHVIPLTAALADGLFRRMCEVTGEQWSPDAEAQWEADLRAEYGEDAGEELDCVPSQGGGKWLSWDLIRGAEHPDAGDPAHYSRHLGPTVIGNDIARHRHLWVAWVLQVVGDVCWTREVSILQAEPFSTQDAELDRLVGHYQPMAIAMDRTGLGEKPFEDAKRRYGESRMEGVPFTNAHKQDLAVALRQVMEDSRLRIPAGDGHLRADLRSVRQEFGPTGAPRLVADETEEAVGRSHGDRFWALALAAAAASRPAVRLDGPISRVRAATESLYPEEAGGYRTTDEDLRGSAADLLEEFQPNGPGL